MMIPGSKGHADSSCLHVRGCMHLYDPPKHEKVARLGRISNVLGLREHKVRSNPWVSSESKGILTPMILEMRIDMGLADTFKALSDPQRRSILEYLKKERLTAGELAQRLEVTPAALSYHLKILKKADLIMEYKEKNFIYYELNASVLDELILWTKQF